MKTRSNNLFRLARQALILALAMLAPLASVAGRLSDNAGATAYDDGRATGDNGGSGMGVWTLRTSGTAGHFIENTNCNIAVGSDCWGMYANSSGQSDAVRTFNSAMSVGEVFTISMDNGNIQSGGSVGSACATPAAKMCWSSTFPAGASNYTYCRGRWREEGFGCELYEQWVEDRDHPDQQSTYYMVITKLSDSSVKRYACASCTTEWIPSIAFGCSTSTPAVETAIMLISIPSRQTALPPLEAW